MRLSLVFSRARLDGRAAPALAGEAVTWQSSNGVPDLAHTSGDGMTAVRYAMRVRAVEPSA